jgi:diaminopimelate epimerase
MQFASGHGTGNDFVVLPDLGGELELTARLVRALCDRRFGIGGDGVLRVVPTAKVDEVAGLASEAHWFMDYRNADGSVAEMCGNGIRLYARWLQRSGLVGDRDEIPVATRDGVKVVRLDGDGDIEVDLGPVEVVGAGRTVTTAGVTRDATEIHTGNPHLVVRVADVADAGPLSSPPDVEPYLEANVEFVVVRGPDEIAMRVHERGSGETLSCGTGACAAAVAAGVWAGAEAGDWAVEVPGGRLRVGWHDGRLTLTGPAEVVAWGELDPGWLASR